MNKSITKFLLGAALVSSSVISLSNVDKANADNVNESVSIKSVKSKSSIKAAPQSKINVKVKDDKHKISGSFYHLDTLSDSHGYDFYASESKDGITVIPMVHVVHDNKEYVMAYSLNKKDAYLIPTDDVNISGATIKSTANYDKLKKIINHASKDVIKEDIDYSKDSNKNDEQMSKDNKKLQKKISNNLKDNQLYHYLSSHKDASMQEIDVFVPNNENPTGLESGKNTIYLVGSEDQLNKAVDGINNYHPSNSIAVLQNDSGVTIFDNNYSEVNDIGSLYAQGEKVLVGKRMNTNDAMNKVKSYIKSNTYLVDNE